MLAALKHRIKRLEHRLSWTWGDDVSTPRARRTALWHYNLIDHGFARVLWTNLYELAPGVWRSNQPGPKRIERYARMGIREIISLRGHSDFSFQILEEHACEALGIKFHVRHLAARSLVPRDKVLEVLDLFDTVERPFLMHCKSGADRAGLASAMYLIHCEGWDPDVAAKKHLSMRFWHSRLTKTGILDFMMAEYTRAYRNSGIALRDWVATVYDPEALTRDFRAGRR